MANKQKETKDVLLSAALALPAILGIVKGSRAIHQAWAAQEPGSFKSAVHDILSRIIDVPEVLKAGDRPADQIFANAGIQTNAAYVKADGSNTAMMIAGYKRAREQEKNIRKFGKKRNAAGEFVEQISKRDAHTLANPISSYWANVYGVNSAHPLVNNDANEILFKSSAKLMKLQGIIGDLPNNLATQVLGGEHVMDEHTTLAIQDELFTPNTAQNKRYNARLKAGLALVLKDKSYGNVVYNFRTASDEALQNAIMVMELKKHIDAGKLPGQVIETVESEAADKLSAFRKEQYMQTRKILVDGMSTNKTTQSSVRGVAELLAVDLYKAAETPGEMAQYSKLIAFANAYSEVYGRQPIATLEAGFVTMDDIRQNAVALETRFSEMQASQAPSSQVVKVLKKTAQKLNQANKERLVDTFTKVVNPQVKFGKPQAFTLGSSGDIRNWLDLANGNPNHLERLRTRLHKDMYRVLGQGAVYDKFHNPGVVAERLGKQLDNIKQVVLRAKADAKNRAVLGAGADQKKLKVLTDLLEKLQFKVEGYTFDNAGITQQHLKLSYISGGLNASVLVPINVRGVVTPTLGGQAQVSTLYQRTVLNRASGFNPDLDGLVDYTAGRMDSIERTAEKALNDFIETFTNPDRTEGLWNRLARKDSTKLSPAELTGADFRTALTVQSQEMDFRRNAASYNDYVKVLEGKRGLELLDTGGIGIAFDMEFSHSMASQSAGLQQVARHPSSEIWQGGQTTINLFEDRVTFMPKGKTALLAKPNAFGMDEVLTQRVKDWVLQQVGDRGEANKIIKALEETTSTPAKMLIQMLDNMSTGINAMSADRGDDLFPVIFIGQAHTQADIPLMERALNSELGLTRKLKTKFKNILSKLFNTDPRSETFSHFNIQSAYHVLKMGQNKAESQTDIFKDIYNVSTDEFSDILQYAQNIANPSTHQNKAGVLRGFDQGRIKDANRILGLIQANDLHLKFDGTATGHLAQFDSMVSVLNYFGIKRLYNDMGSREKRRIREYTEVAANYLQKGGQSAEWHRSLDIAAQNQELFGIYDKWGVNGAPAHSLGLSLMSQPRHSASDLRGTLLSLEGVMPFGLLNNFSREKYQVLSARVLNPNGPMTGIYGHGGVLETEASATIRQYVSAQYSGSFDDTDKFNKFISDRLGTSEKLNYNLMAKGVASSLYGVLDNINSDNKLAHTHQMVVMTLMPESFAPVFESGLVVTDELRQNLSSYKGIKQVKAQFKLNLSSASPAGLAVSAGALPEAELVKVLSGIGKHKAIGNAINRVIADGLLQERLHLHLDGSFTLGLNSQQEGWDLVNNWIKTGKAPGGDIAVRNKDRVFGGMTRSSLGAKADGAVIGSIAADTRYHGQIPGIPQSLHYDADTGYLTVNLAQYVPGGVGTKAFYGDKTAKFSINALMGFGRGLNIDPLYTQAASGIKLGGNRNEIASNIIHQINRIQLKLVLDGSEPDHTKRTLEKAFSTLLGPDVASQVKYVKRKIKTTNAAGNLVDHIIYVPEIPAKIETTVLERVDLHVLENMLEEAGVTWGYVKDKFNKSAKKLWNNDAKVVSQWAAGLTKQKQALGTLLEQATNSGDKLKARHFKRWKSQVGDDTSAALFDIVPVQYGHLSMTSQALRILTSMSVTSDATDFWMMYMRPEQANGLPSLKPKALAMFNTIVMDSIGNRHNDIRSMEDFGYLAGFYAPKLGFNYVNREGKQPVRDAAKTVQLISAYMQGESNRVLKKKITKVGSKALEESLEKLRKASIFDIDFTTQEWAGATPEMKAAGMLAQFGQEFQDTQTGEYIQLAGMAESRISQVRAAFFDSDNLFGALEKNDPAYRGFKLDSVDEMLDKIDMSKFNDEERDAFRKAIKKRIGTENMTLSIKHMGAVKDLAIHGELQSAGSMDKAKFKAFREFIESNADKRGPNIIDEVIFPALTGILRPHDKDGLAIMAGASSKFLEGAEAISAFQTAFHVGIKETAEEDFMREYNRRRELTSEIVDRASLGILGHLFEQSKFRSTASTVSMSHGKIMNSMGILPTLISMQEQLSLGVLEDSKIKLPGWLKKGLGQEFVASKQSELQLSTILNRITGGGSPIDPVTGVVRARGLGVNESFVFGKAGARQLKEAVKTGDLSYQEAYQFFTAEISGKQLRDRNPSHIQGMVLAGGTYIFPEQVGAVYDGGAGFSTRSSVFLDPLAMKFLRADQDGDTAAIINIGGWRDREGKIGIKRTMYQQSHENHTNMLIDWQKIQIERDGGTPYLADIFDEANFATESSPGGTRQLYKLDKAAMGTNPHLFVDPSEALSASFFKKQLEMDSRVDTQLAYMTQKSFTQVIGGFHKKLYAAAYGPNSVMRQLGSLLNEGPQREAASGMFNRMMEEVGLHAKGITSNSVLEALDYLHSPSDLMGGYSNMHVMNLFVAELGQRTGIEKTSSNPVTSLIKMMGHLNTVTWGEDRTSLDASIDYFTKRMGEDRKLTLTYHANRQDLASMNDATLEKAQLRAGKLLESWHTASIAVHKLGSTLVQLQTDANSRGDDTYAAKLGDLMQAVGAADDLANKTKGITVSSLESQISRDQVLRTEMSQMIAPELKRMGLARSSASVFQTLLELEGHVGGALAEEFNSRRIFTEKIKQYTKSVFALDQNSFLRNHGRKVLTVAGLALFFDPNTGNQIVGETIGKGGEQYDTPNMSEVTKGYRNRKSVHLKEQSATLKDKLMDKLKNSPDNAPQLVKGMRVPERPHYEYNNKKRRHTAISSSDYLRRAGSLVR